MWTSVSPCLQVLNAWREDDQVVEAADEVGRCRLTLSNPS